MYDDLNKRPIDRPWLVVDNSTTQNSGTLYITTKPAPWISPPNRNYYKVSTDSGHTWSAIANVDGGTHLVGSVIAAPMATPAVTLNGKFCAVFPSYVSSQNPLPAYYFAYSYDRGQTISYNTMLSALPAPNDTNFKNGYLLKTSRTDSSKMIFLIPDAMSGDADIMAMHSNDGGQTWSNRIRVNDDTLSNGKSQDMVWAAYNELGNIIVTWRDRRNSSSNGFWNAGYDFYYALSTDNGQTFLANQKLSGQFIQFDSVLTQNGNDFMSCTYQGDTLYSVWGDSRSGKMNIYFAKTIVSTNTGIGFAHLDGDEAQWYIFPNPIHEELNAMISREMIGKKISIYDEEGKILYREICKENSIQIGTKEIKSGVYFIQIGNTVKRFVKQ